MITSFNNLQVFMFQENLSPKNLCQCNIRKVRNVFMLRIQSWDSLYGIMDQTKDYSPLGHLSGALKVLHSKRGYMLYKNLHLAFLKVKEFLGIFQLFLLQYKSSFYLFKKKDNNTCSLINELNQRAVLDRTSTGARPLGPSLLDPNRLVFYSLF